MSSHLCPHTFCVILLTSSYCVLFVDALLLWSSPSCFVFAVSRSSCIVFSYSCVYTHSEASLIGGVSADRLTNSLFINGMSVSGRDRREEQFNSVQWTLCFPAGPFSLQAKSQIKDKKIDIPSIKSDLSTADSPSALPAS